MTLNNKIKQSGFTIVELLIVIVVIGILAAITIVAFNGIQNRSRTTTAQAAANNVVKKVEVYNTDVGTYPNTFDKMSTAASNTSYYLTGVTLATTALAAAPSTPSTVNYYACGVGAAAAATSHATVTTVTGNQVRYWDWSTNAAVTVSTGQTSGTFNTFNVTCWISTT